MTDKLIALTTCGTEADAAALAREIIEHRAAACVNVVPGVRSFYRWRGKIEDEREFLLVMKTTRGKLEALRETVLKLHPYDLPEFVALPVEAGSEEYLGWVEAAVSRSADD
jgi:periplasmic divalent cation tolerance protein